MLLATTQPPANAKIVGLIVACIPLGGDPYSEGLKGLDGQTHTNLSAVLETRRGELLSRLELRARARGATAVFGIAFDFREISPRWKELCAYGTGVLLP